MPEHYRMDELTTEMVNEMQAEVDFGDWLDLVDAVEWIATLPDADLLEVPLNTALLEW